MTDTVGQRLKALRLGMGWTQLQLANLVNDRCGWNWQQTTVQKIEAGSRPLSLADVEALMAIHERTFDDLLYGRRTPARFTAIDAKRRVLRVEAEALRTRLAEIEDEQRRLDAEFWDGFTEDERDAEEDDA